MGKKGSDGLRSFLGEPPCLEGSGGESVAAMVHHSLCKVASVGGSLHTEVAEHGV